MQFLTGFGEALAREVELPAEPRGVGERFLQPAFPDTLARLPFRGRFGKRRLQPGGFDTPKNRANLTSTFLKLPPTIRPFEILSINLRIMPWQFSTIVSYCTICT